MFDIMKVTIAAFALAGLASCQSAPTQDKMARTTTETAPADLQLACANAAAATAKTDSSKILPTGSSRLDAETFSVELNASGKSFSCLVGTNGVVKSVTPTS